MFKTSIISIFLLVPILASWMASQAQAAPIAFALVGAADWGKVSQDTVSTKAGFGGGALIDIGMAPMVSFEFGGLYVDRKFDDSSFSVTSQGVTTNGATLQANFIQVPVLLRWWLSPMISLGAGGYWETQTGSVNVTDDASGATTSSTAADANLKSSDYGAVGSLALRLPLGTSGWRFLVDARYTYGLSDAFTSAGSTEKYRDVQVLAGFSFPLESGR